MRAILTTGLTLLLAATMAPAERPNIILILVDDMGFSDLGCYGGEIQTPHIDALAKSGVRFSRFYNHSRCCPTRASLLTGLAAAQTGVGTMTNPPGRTNHDHGPKFPGYRGYLNRNCVTIAEALHPAGYATLMAGKWHLGREDKDRWPLQRGFEKFYGCLDGATRFFSPSEPNGIHSMNEPDEELKSTTDRAYYTTDAFTDHAIRFIREEREGKRRPFFLYLAYTAPHWPLQAHEKDIDKYRNTYRQGWDKLREQRYRKQISLGLINPRWELSPRSSRVPAWDKVKPEKQEEMALRMAIYAAMIDRVDQNIGKLSDSLEKMGIAENTLILFLSDNGACEEGGVMGRGPINPPSERNESGNISVGEAWANASNTPFRLFKRFTHEGGAATPFLAHWPAGIKPQARWHDQPGSIVDVMPTILEVTGAKYPGVFEGNRIPPLSGESLVPVFEGRTLKRKNAIFSEHFGNASIIDGDWKLVGRKVAGKRGVHADRWELYNLADDRTELHDLAKQMPDRVRSMSDQWLAWARKSQVYPKP